MTAPSDALVEIDAAKADLAQAFGAILAAAEAGLRSLSEAVTGDTDRAFCAIIMACTAEDIVGQRLTKAQRLLRGDRIDALLEGPAASGQGLNQAMADTLFESGTVGAS